MSESNNLFGMSKGELLGKLQGMHRRAQREEHAHSVTARELAQASMYREEYYQLHDRYRELQEQVEVLKLRDRNQERHLELLSLTGEVKRYYWVRDKHTINRFDTLIRAVLHLQLVDDYTCVPSLEVTDSDGNYACYPAPTNEKSLKIFHSLLAPEGLYLKWSPPPTGMLDVMLKNFTLVNTAETDQTNA